MTASESVQKYLQISDMMYQALKSGKYEIFENALNDREELLKEMTGSGNIFDSTSLEDKQKWAELIQDADAKIAIQMELFKNKMEQELIKLQKEQGQVRKQESVNRYNSSSGNTQGGRFNQLK